ncbi:MAG: VapC toxin family PIN domain ribonuclease, partial [Polyangiales bacterium]
SYAFAAERAATFYASKNLQILRPDEKQEKLALKLFGKFADQQVSFTDCVSFTLMKTHSLRRAFAYDQHFRFAGFELMPAA